MLNMPEGSCQVRPLGMPRIVLSYDDEASARMRSAISCHRLTEVTAGLLNRNVDVSIHILDLWNFNSSPDGR